MLVTLVLWSGALRADAGPETPEALRNELLRGQTPGDWDGTLKAILALPGEQVGDALGPIFNTSEHARRLDLLARVSVYLASHAIKSNKGEQVLLANLILRRALASDGDAFLDRLHEQLVVDRTSGRRPDWDRLLEVARELLDQPKAEIEDRLAAITFLARERAERSGDVVAALTIEAKRQANPATTTPERREELEQALLDALDQVLAFRFLTAADAARQLEETKDLTFLNRLRHFSHLKDGGDRAVAVKLMGEAVKRMETPAALTEALLQTGSYPDVRKFIVQRAGELKPRPVIEWTTFFVEFFRHVRDKDVVLAGLDLLASAGFGGGPGECCSLVAEAIQERLSRRSPPDRPEVRQRMVSTLGDLGSLEPVARQMQAIHERGTVSESEAPEVVELVLAAGRCPRAHVELLKPFYSMAGTTPEVRDQLRWAVARALGREGVRDTDPVAAVTALTSILEGGEGWERATFAKARGSAISSLGAYPGPETAKHVLRYALTEGSESQDEALRAIETLAKMMSAGTGGHHGALGLVTLLRATKGKPDLDARRIEALKRLKDLPAGDAVPQEVRAAVLAAVREVLAEPGSDALRAQAARTAAVLADADAIPALTAWVIVQPTPEHGLLLQSLLDAVVLKPAPNLARPDSDARVVEALRAVGKVPGFAGKAVEWAEGLARSGARSGAPRPLLVSAQAETLINRAGTWPSDSRGATLRRGDLVTAAGILRLAHQGARAPEEAERVRPLLMDALERLAESWGPGEEAKALYLEAVALAAKSSAPSVLQAGARLGRRLKEEDGLKRLLKPAEQAELDRQLEVIRLALER